MKLQNHLLGSLLLLSGIGCVHESQRAVVTPTMREQRAPVGDQIPLVVGDVRNDSTYLRGVFSDGVDRVGGQAKMLLKTQLGQSGRFAVMDRDTGETAAKEASIAGRSQVLQGADYVISGAVTEFGRRDTSDHALFGLLGRNRAQMAYSRFTINVVDVHTSRILYSVEGAGEYELSAGEVLGFGSSSGYDSTLTAKVLGLSVSNAVDKLVAAVANHELGLGLARSDS